MTVTTELPKTLVNGKPGDTLSVYDRGTAYGHGLFETVLICHGRPQLWDEHMRRLLEGCSRLGLQLPTQFESILIQEVWQLCEADTEGVIKIIITAGSGGRGYLAPQEMHCQRIVSLFPVPVYPETHASEGVQIRTCQYRLSDNSQLAGIKHLNRMDQVLARSEWQDPAIAEGIVTDSRGYAIEGTMSNLFAVQDGMLLTPSLQQCGVKGVMRDYVLSIANAMGMQTQEVDFSVDEFKCADEIFLTNSIIGLWPVKQWDGQRYYPGIITGVFQQRIERLDVESAGNEP